MTGKQTHSKLEFSRVVEVAALQGKRTDVTFEATDAENEALARRFGVDGISGFTADVTLTPFSSGNKVAVKASFAAEVKQTCVVTLEPLTTRVTGGFAAEFVPTAFIGQSVEVEFEPSDDDPPEPIVEGKIEIGELVAQHLALEIDPFPRVPGVEFQGLQVGEDESGAGQAPRSSPFAVLEKLKGNKG